MTAFAGSSFSNATYVAVNSSTEQYISSSGAYFRFYVSQSGDVTIYSGNSDIDPVGTLYDSNEDYVAENDDGNGNSDFLISSYLSKGTYYLYVKDYNGYSGYTTINIRGAVSGTDISDAYIDLDENYYTYDGEEKEPLVTVYYNGKTLYEGYDYELEYSNNINAGRAMVSVFGIGNYSGSAHEYFTIEKADISYAYASLSTKTYTYNGNAKKPGVTVKYDSEKLRKNTDYTVKYSKNKNRGKANVVITGKGNFTGKKTLHFTIKPKKVKYCFINTCTYNGKLKNPAIHYNKKVKEYDSYADEYYTYTKTATFKKGRDYTVKYYGSRRNIGTCTVKIRFKGNYTGTLTKRFKIVPAKVKKIRISKRTRTSMYVKWAKVKGAAAYKVYRYNYKKGKFTFYKTLKSPGLTIYRSGADDFDISFYIKAVKVVKGKTYSSEGSYKWDDLKPDKISIKLRRTDFGKWTCTFKKYGYYEYQVSKTKSFSSIYSNWKGYTDQIVSYNYPSGVRFYIRARRYIYHNGVLEVGPWSDVKSVVPY
jgi:hypothetical protein